MKIKFENLIKLLQLHTKSFALAILGLSLSAGCSSMQSALKITQEIEGNGNATLVTPLNITSASIENARQENGMFRADRVDIVHIGKLTGTRVEMHFENYGRRLLE